MFILNDFLIIIIYRQNVCSILGGFILEINIENFIEELQKLLEKNSNHSQNHSWKSDKPLARLS